MKETDTLLRKQYIKIKESVDEINSTIYDMRDCGDSRAISLQKANKKSHILMVKCINAFLLRDLELLKTLNKEYLECSSNFLSFFNELMEDEEVDLGIDVNGIEKRGENSYLILCNDEKITYETQLTLIENLENYQSHY